MMDIIIALPAIYISATLLNLDPVFGFDKYALKRVPLRRVPVPHLLGAVLYDISIA